jgi:hypothetical protein
MDPNTCWQEMEEAVNTANWGIAVQKAEALIEWLQKDGFPPVIGGHPVFDRIVARATSELIAAWVM